MPTDLPKQYDPAEAQQKWFAFWESHGYFNADPPPEDAKAGKPPHTIMIPLPNVTGALHMGHALNGTCQDLITRWRRMQGFEALWMPGTDHAGIGTQAVVERRMFEEEGLTRRDIGREALVNRIWRWKDAYEERILSQLKTLGASCDWRRTRFTLDDVCSKAVRRTFFKMFKDGLIFRGKRLVNWDVHLQTAVADDEVFEEDIDGHFWTFHYPVVDEHGRDTDVSIRFSTTRPETMLGDTAVCVHPTDERYRHLIGKQVRIPLNGRLIPIIADGLLADKELGTGAVKVTPGHDPNDYACYGRKLGQPDEIGVIDLLNLDGTVAEVAGNPKYVGKDRLKVREMVVDDMAELGFFDKIEDRKIPLKHSDRSKTPIEPIRSDQWFVKMGPHTTPDGRSIDLAQSAMDAVKDGRVQFYPSRYASTYLDWLGEKRDWCISRQLWWGHRIPVWTFVWSGPYATAPSDSQQVFMDLPFLNEEQNQQLAFHVVRPGEKDGTIFIGVCVPPDRPEIEALIEANGGIQDPDVLDTWFSSALWPHATLGWPDLEHDPPLDEKEMARQTQMAQSEPRGLSPRDRRDKPGGSQPGGSPNRVLPYFYPHAEPADGNQSVLITSRDIITLWVARMVLTGLYNMGEIPFRHVHIHPKILDGFGQGMSKSKGNGVDPVDLIDKYGTDAVRFTIASFAGETQDVRIPISYECPSCGESIPQKQYKAGAITYVVPETLQGEFPVGANGGKPRLRCPKCKTESQFSTPAYDPDPDEPVAVTVSERFEYGRNFCNKLWNAARFALLNLEGYTPGPVDVATLPLEDRWILSRLSTVAREMTDRLGEYQFDAATRAVRDFTWNEFCDWYLEMIKPRLRASDPDASERPGHLDETRDVAQRVLVAVLDTLLRLLQPFTPFLCEELWQRLKDIAPQRGLAQPIEAEEAAIIARWPIIPADEHEDETPPGSVTVASPKLRFQRAPQPWISTPQIADADLERRFERLQETIVAVRNVRAVYNIPPSTTLPLVVRCEENVAADLRNVAGQFANLAKAELTAAGPDVERPPASASFSLADADGFIPLEGVIDRNAELARQHAEAAKLRKHIAGHEGKLANENFTAKAPADVVANVRETLANLKSQLASVEQIIHDLGGE